MSNKDLIDLEYIRTKYEEYCFEIMEKLEKRLPYLHSSRFINMSSNKKDMMRKIILSFMISEFNYWMNKHYEFEEHSIDPYLINRHINETSEVALNALGLGLQHLLEINHAETTNLLTVLARLQENAIEHIEEWAIETIVEDDKTKLKSKYKS